VNRSGVESQLPIPMSPEEEAGVRASADTIRKAIRTLGF
jgi:L-lactate dehydrogenase